MTMPHSNTIYLVGGSVFVVAVVWLVYLLRRPPFSPLQWIMLWGSMLLAKRLWHTRVNNALPVKAGQGAVLVANHRSAVDPFFIQLAANRVVHWMVAREYVEHPAFSWFLRRAGAIPANRGGIDTAATREAIRLAANGELVGMLPEGRINMTDEFLMPVRPGAAMVALRARVPLIPCFIDGAPYNKTIYSPFFMRAKVRVTIGTPIDLSPYYDRHADPDVVRTLIVRCMSEIARLSGRQEYDVQLAGRNWNPRPEELP